MSKRGATYIADRILALVYLFTIYLTLPAMPALWERAVDMTGDFSQYAAHFLLVLCIGAVCAYIALKHKNRFNFIWVFVVALCYAVGLSRLELSIERVHFIEYGILAVLAFRALRHSFAGLWAYFWSAIFVGLAGYIDECIQYKLPTRMYDSRDVLVNAVAGVLALILVAICVKPNER